MFKDFTNQYTLSKTVTFELIPQGNTLKHMEANGILDVEKQRKENFEIVKKGIDEYHKDFINLVLSNLELDGLEEYYELSKIPYKEKTDKEKKQVMDIEAAMRKSIAQHIRQNETFHLLFSKELISDILPEYYAEDEQMLGALASFDGFTTYFRDFHSMRESLYSDERKASTIAFRIVHENLPKFIANIDTFKKIDASPAADCFGDIEKWIGELTGTDGVAGIIESMFSLENFSRTATQEGINNYNLLISGYMDEDGFLHKGLNNYINEYNQKVDYNDKLPLFIPLFKQMLSDRETVSFVPAKLNSDQETLDCIRDLYGEIRDSLYKMEMLVSSINGYDLEKIYIKSDKSIAEISRELYGNWEYIQKALAFGYDKENRPAKVRSEEKYAKKRAAYFNKIKSFSIADLNAAIRGYDGGMALDIQEYFKTGMSNNISMFEVIDDMYDGLADLLTVPYPEEKRLSKDQKSIERIKAFLDKLKEFQKRMKPLCGTGEETDKDGVFYGEFTILWDEIDRLNLVYNKVRNYVTRKVTAAEKVKLNFSNPMLGGGWSQNVERQKGMLLFRDRNEKGRYIYYLGIINKEVTAKFNEYPLPSEPKDAIDKMFYYQSADPTKVMMNLMVDDTGKTVKKNGKKEKTGPYAGINLELEELKNKYLPEDVNRIRKNKGYLKSSEHFNEEDLQTFIKYYKQRIKEYIPECDFGEDFDSIYFEDWNDYLAHVKKKAYQAQMKPISKAWLDERVEEGDLYLFQLYNADFNPNKKGKKKITTRYFEKLFDQDNFKDGTVYKLNGGAEIFYRPATLSIKDTAIHPAGEAITNKNPLNEKKTSVFNYPIIKNRNATRDMFTFNCSIECNFSADTKVPLNVHAREAIRANDGPLTMIGISRGENHLLYYSVVDEYGNILEQDSLNVINKGETNGKVHLRDYHALLESKAVSRSDARQNWQTIDDIKNLKEGYLSEVVYVITKLMMKYNAMLAIEEISSDFKQGRQKIEKAVYDKFDKAITNKLCFLIDKDKDDNEIGGLLKPLQLAAPESKDNQNGFLFYVQPSYTSGLDPTTGFMNAFGRKLNYTNANDAVHFIKKLDGITYNAEEEYFEFDFDYLSFGLDKGVKTKWTVCSYGSRVKAERNRTNGRWEYDSVNLTKAYKELFENFGIDIKGDIQEQILMKADVKLVKGFMELFKLTLQMRNKIADEYHVISPVKNKDGVFYNTSENDDTKAQCLAGNGAYNIARKGLIYIDKIRAMEEDALTGKLNISNDEWFSLVQN